MYSNPTYNMKEMTAPTKTAHLYLLFTGYLEDLFLIPNAALKSLSFLHATTITMI